MMFPDTGCVKLNVAGVSPNPAVIVGYFSDSDISASGSSFSASINWGDGNISAGQVAAVANSPGIFSISGSNLYARAQAYTVITTVSDNLNDSVVLTSPASVVGAVLLQSGNTTADFIAGVAPGTPVVVGSFIDSNTAATASGISALIYWGNGNVSVGSVAMASGTTGVFTVSGSNDYATAKTYPVTIKLQDNLGDSGTITSTADVIGDMLTPVSGTAGFTAGVPPASGVTIGSFYDSNTTAPASSFAASIYWGDGNVSAGTVTTSGTAGLYVVTGSNTYAAAGKYMAGIVVTTQDGSTTTIWSNAFVTTNTVYGFTGGMSNLVSNGPFSSLGYTNTNEPTFSGTAAPFAVVQIYGRHFNADALVSLGEAVANGNGQWTFTSAPLAGGRWIITATATPPGGYPGNAVTLTTGDPSERDILYVDRKPSAGSANHGGAQLSHAHGAVRPAERTGQGVRANARHRPVF